MPTDLDSSGPDDPVLVSPRYLAGPGLEQPSHAAAFAWSSLTNADWSTYTPDSGPLLCASPCQLVRTARLPNQADSWRTAVYEDALVAAWWTATWSAETPVELIADFHHALAEAHATGTLHSHTGATDVSLPLLTANWRHTVDGRGERFTDPTGLAKVTNHRLRHGGEAWRLTVLPETRGSCRWSASFSRQVPNVLVAAVTASLVAATPVHRTAGQLPKELHRHLVTEPAPPSAPDRSEAVVSAPVRPPDGPGHSPARRR
ncbi:DUF317 domain-containing protein [Streptomyces niveus]|uniref:DUF317 domain-containing protein n=1 Tax=Streptomyces niveus TaxID=193462 RepID=UPI00084CD866|nr:DUF317 domain-containing protein [Streptomyces niveus]